MVGIGAPTLVESLIILLRRLEGDPTPVSKNIFGGIAYPAHKYGRVIYEAACTGAAGQPGA